MTTPNPEIRPLSPTEQAFLNTGFPLESDPADFHFVRVQHTTAAHNDAEVNPDTPDTVAVTYPIPREFTIDGRPYRLTNNYAAVGVHATIDDYSSLNKRVIVHPGAEVTRSDIGAGVEVPSNAVIQDSHIQEKVSIGERAGIFSSTINQGTQIGPNNRITNSHIGEGVQTGSRVKITGSQLGQDVQLGTSTCVETATIENRVIIENQVTVKPNVTVGRNATIYSETTVAADIGTRATVLHGTIVTGPVPADGIAIPEGIQHLVQGDRIIDLSSWVLRFASKSSE